MAETDKTAKRKKALEDLVRIQKDLEGDSDSDIEKELEKKIDLAKRLRWNEQCFLMEPETIKSLQRYQRNQPGFKSLILLDSNNPRLATHQLMGKKGIEDLLNLSPVQTALLVPKIRIFRVDYSKDKKHGEEKELLFSDHTSQKSIEKITLGRVGRGDDVGLKSFDYEFFGKQPAEGGLMSCTMTLHFQDLQTLFERESGRANFLDLILPEAKHIKEMGKNFLDEHGELIPPQQLWNPKYFRLKVVVGWSEPQDPQEVVFSEKEKRIVRESSVVLFLDLKDHTIDLREDGSAELTTLYNGALEGSLKKDSSNLLAMTKYGKLIKAFKEEIGEATEKNKDEATKRPLTLGRDISPAVAEAARKATEGELKVEESQAIQDVAGVGRNVEHSFFDSILGKSYTTKSRETVDKRKKTVKQLRKKAPESAVLTLAKLEAVDKQIRYSRIIDKLIEDGKVWYVDVGTESTIKETDEISRQIEGGEVERLTRARISSPPKLVSRKEEYRSFGESLAITKKLAGIGKLSYGAKLSDTLSDKENEGESKKIKATLDRGTSSTFAGRAGAVESKKTRINYIFLGDLFELALDLLKTNDRTDVSNMNVILGPIVYKNPQNIEEYVSYNLADLPISLTMFSAWFINEVIRPQREKLFINDFFKELVNKIIIPALGETCNEAQVRNPKPMIHMSTFSLPGLGKDGKTNPLSITRGGRHNIDELLKTTPGQDLNRSTHKSIKKLHHYLYIYAANLPIVGRLNGNVREDSKRHIYHLYQGKDSGLVKNIKFSKVDAPYEKAWRSTSMSEDAMKIRGLYNANVRMIGNTLFINGQIVYLDVERIGIRKNINQRIGLGGYYQIIKVSHHLSKDDYETELECKYVGGAGGDFSRKIRSVNINTREACSYSDGKGNEAFPLNEPQSRRLKDADGCKI